MPKPRAARRRDPKSRPPDGARPWDKLIDPDPAMHYVYVDPNAELFGVDFYESIGYEQVLLQKGGVRPAIGKVKNEGSVVTVMSQVLMQIPLEKKAELEKWGVGGSGGQSHVDEIEQVILRPGGIDGLRGMQGVFEVVNETERPRVELER